MDRIYRFFGGVTETHAAVFATAGLVAFFIGRLNGGQFIALISAVQVLVTSNDIHDAWQEAKKAVRS